MTAYQPRDTLATMFKQLKERLDKLENSNPLRRTTLSVPFRRPGVSFTTTIMALSYEDAWVATARGVSSPVWRVRFTVRTTAGVTVDFQVADGFGAVSNVVTVGAGVTRTLTAVGTYPQNLYVNGALNPSPGPDAELYVAIRDKQTAGMAGATVFQPEGLDLLSELVGQPPAGTIRLT